MKARRALHFVFKVGDRAQTIRFYRELLGMRDGHEICFVGDEAFRELSKVDPNGEKLLDEAMAADKSHEWFAKHNLPKPSA
ncbi:putative Glyoxalase domain-containing protein [Naja naja]|nr:putative Glyoxalase domain-containing protein [Naja naja]